MGWVGSIEMRGVNERRDVAGGCGGDGQTVILD
jgi:hypothetical protein